MFVATGSSLGCNPMTDEKDEEKKQGNSARARRWGGNMLLFDRLGIDKHGQNRILQSVGRRKGAVSQRPKLDKYRIRSRLQKNCKLPTTHSLQPQGSNKFQSEQARTSARKLATVEGKGKPPSSSKFLELHLTKVANAMALSVSLICQDSRIRC